MANLKLFVFGPPRLERDGEPVELNLRKALALLVYLAASGQPHSRDALATMLWPESVGREGRARLRRTLYRLNEAIGDDILDSGPALIRLRPGAGLWLDSAAFRQHVSAGPAASPHDRSAPERLAHLSAAVALYTEDFLAGFTLPDSPAFDEWQFFQREGLRQLCGQVLEQMVQAHRAQGAWDEAIAHARRWLALDALYEPAHRALMRLYASAGQHAAALRQYQECARLLQAELGAEPEEETVGLHEAIRTRQLGTAPTAPPSAGSASSRAEHAGAPVAPVSAQGGGERDHAPGSQLGAPLFVARQQELAWLDRLLDAAREGRHGVAFVTGEAGQGKTSLLRAFARSSQAAHPELVVAWGSCDAYTGVGDPYLPFREILELLTGGVDADAPAGHPHPEYANRLRHTAPAAAQALVDVGPDLLGSFVPARGLLRRASAYALDEAAWAQQLRELVERNVARPADPRQQHLFEQYARVVQELAQRAPLLLLLDDLQWADRGSADLLFHLGRRLNGSRVLLVGAYRPADVAIGRDGQRHPLERVVGELQRDFGDIRLDLGQAEGRELVDSLLDAEPNRLDERFHAALYQQTGGHPLFTIELLRDLQERGVLTRDDAGNWVASPHLEWTRLPARVEGVIGERVGRLDARLRELLQVASVEGEEFTAEVVARVVGADEQAVVRQLSRELDQKHRLVRAVGVRRDDDARLSRYRFQHILIQRYLYGSLDAVEQAYQHEAVGHELEALYAGRSAEIAAQLARHFEAAQLPEKAATYNAQAGDLARRSAALEEALHFYQRALDQWPARHVAERAKLLRKLGECQWMRSHLQNALATLEACHALYQALGDREGAGAALRLIGRLHWERGDREESLQHYHRSLALLEQGPENVELAHTISAISQMHMLASANVEAVSWGQRALAMAERLAAEDVMVHALANIGAAYFGLGDVERGTAMLRRSWRRAVELNLSNDACRAANNLGVGLTYLGLPAEARAIVEDLHSYAVRMQLYLYAGSSLILLAKLDWLSGRWQSALTRRRQILEWIGQGQSTNYLEVNADTAFAWMHNDLGQAAAARQLLERSQSNVAGRAEIQTTGPYLGQHVRALGALGHDDEATAAAQQFLVLVEPHRSYVDPSMSHLVVCRWFAERTPAMRAELMTCLAQVERADTQFHSPSTAAALSEARGLAALSEKRVPQAVAYLQQAVAQWRALGRPYDQMRASLDLGRAHTLGGDAGAARAALGLAQGLVEALAAQLEDAEMRTAFLRSPLVQELHSADGHYS